MLFKYVNDDAVFRSVWLKTNGFTIILILFGIPPLYNCNGYDRWCNTLRCDDDAAIRVHALFHPGVQSTSAMRGEKGTKRSITV